MNMNRSLLLSVLFFVPMLVFAMATTHAEGQQAGLVVTPALLDISIGSKQPEATAWITVHNSFSNPVELVATLGGLNQDGVRLVPSGIIDPNLGAAVSFEPNLVTVQPDKDATLTVRFKDSEQLAPGGHYGSITIRQVSTGNGQVGLQGAVSVGMFVTKLDGAILGVDVTKVQTNGSLFRLPTTADISFRNSGNMLAVPRAALTTGRSGRVVADGVANAESIGVLPSETVTIRAQLVSRAAAFLPGVYKTQVMYRADGSTEQKIAAVSHFYISLVYVIVVVVLLVMCVALLRLRRAKSRSYTAQSINQTKNTNQADEKSKRISVVERYDGERIIVRKQ